MTYHKPASPAGYCRQKGWKLSYRQIRVKGCINEKKQCKYNNESNCCKHFICYPEHAIWKQLEKAKEKKRKIKSIKAKIDEQNKEV